MLALILALSFAFTPYARADVDRRLALTMGVLDRLMSPENQCADTLLASKFDFKNVLSPADLRAALGKYPRGHLIQGSFDEPYGFFIAVVPELDVPAMEPRLHFVLLHSIASPWLNFEEDELARLFMRLRMDRALAKPGNVAPRSAYARTPVRVLGDEEGQSNAVVKARFSLNARVLPRGTISLITRTLLNFDRHVRPSLIF